MFVGKQRWLVVEYLYVYILKNSIFVQREKEKELTHFYGVIPYISIDFQNKIDNTKRHQKPRL